MQRSGLEFCVAAGRKHGVDVPARHKVFGEEIACSAFFTRRRVHILLNNVTMRRGVVTGSVLQGMALTVPIGGLSFLLMAIAFRD